MPYYSDMVNHILDDHAYVGHRYSDLIGLAEHYGFELKDTTDPKHRVYVHRDYPDLRTTIPFGGGSVKPPLARQVARVCREVRQRNAKGREKTFDKIPQWLLDALPTGMTVEQENNSVVFEANAVVDLDSEYPPLTRRYELCLDGNSLQMHSLDYPGHDTQFRLVDGMRHREQAFQRIFSALDTDVTRHIDALTQAFNGRLRRLQDERGFIFNYTALEGRKDARSLNLYHPLYHLEHHLEKPQNGIITYTLLEQLEGVLRDHDNHFYKQAELLEELSTNGWEITQTQTKNRVTQRTYMYPTAVLSEGDIGELVFKHLKGASFTMSTYGALEMFDMDAIRAITATTDKPVTVVSKPDYKGANKLTTLPIRRAAFVRS